MAFSNIQSVLKKLGGTVPSFKGINGQEELCSAAHITKTFQRSFYSIYTLKHESFLELHEGKQHEN